MSDERRKLSEEWWVMKKKIQTGPKSPYILVVEFNWSKLL